MGNYKNKTYPLRIQNELMEKLKIIAQKEDKIINKMIERMVNEYINEYEAKNGTINVTGGGRIIELKLSDNYFFSCVS